MTSTCKSVEHECFVPIGNRLFPIAYEARSILIFHFVQMQTVKTIKHFTSSSQSLCNSKTLPKGNSKGKYHFPTTRFAHSNLAKLTNH